MSQSFDLGDQVLWNPSNGASRLFLRQVAVFEAELKLPSGIGPMEADECQVDPVAFGAFVYALLAKHRRTQHAVVLALSEGFIATVLVLAERAGIQVRWTQLTDEPGPEATDVQVPPAPTVDGRTWADQLRDKSRELGRRMPR